MHGVHEPFRYSGMTLDCQECPNWLDKTIKPTASGSQMEDIVREKLTLEL